MTAAPKLYAQIGYKTIWHFNTPWWLCTPLQYAAMHDTEGEVTTLLLRAGADVNNCGSLQASPLHIAAATRNTRCVPPPPHTHTRARVHMQIGVQTDRHPHTRSYKHTNTGTLASNPSATHIRLKDSYTHTNLRRVARTQVY
jgi:hypothetical protein